MHKNRQSNAIKLHTALLGNKAKYGQIEYQALLQACKKNGVNIGKLPKEFNVLLLETLNTKDKQLNPSRLLQDVDYSLLSPGEWLELSSYLQSFGLIADSITCRLKSHSAIKTKVAELIYGPIYPKLLISSLIDSGHWLDAKNYICNKFIKPNNPYYKRIISNKDKIGLEINRGLYDLINGKNIAIVGPLAFDKDYREEIENADVIVELNAVKSQRKKVIENKYHGKPNIIYYNNARCQKLVESDFDDYVGADFIVLKTKKYRKEFSNRGNIHIIPRTDDFTWNGSLAMMELAILDILLFDPKSIKVFGVDLYTSFNYDESYGNQPPQDIMNLPLVFFALHDIATQFNLMKKLRELNFIATDDRLSDVLSLDLLSFCKKLDALYPIYIIKG